MRSTGVRGTCYYNLVKKFLLLVAVIFIAAYGWYRLSLHPADATNQTRRPVTIRSGLSVSDIGALLEMKGIIRSARAFSLYARLHRAETELQAGDFLLYPAMSVTEVVQTLRRGFSEEMSMTIPEGFTVKDIDQLLAMKGLIREGDFLACAKTCDLIAHAFLPKEQRIAERSGQVEGYLFPDTYFVIPEGFTVKSFLERLLDTFRSRVVTGLSNDLGGSKRSLQEIVTMASLIEEEAKTDEERPVIAGILWKRFDGKIGLGVDATVRYVLEKPTAAITAKDLDIDSPYNLRKYRGLPPGPIANPGLASITAALHPLDSKYWYYLHGKDGQIKYAETNDEHNRNKALYLP